MDTRSKFVSAQRLLSQYNHLIAFCAASLSEKLISVMVNFTGLTVVNKRSTQIFLPKPVLITP